MARPRKYTPKKLEAGIQEYFDSISRKRVVTEPKPTGEFDKYGHPITEEVPVLNVNGEEIVVEEFAVPPTEADIYTHLGLHRSTWAEYCNPDLHPEFSDTIAQARGRIHAYLQKQVLTQRHVQGVIRELDRMEKKEGPRLEISVSAGSGTAAASATMTLDDKEKLLEQLAQEFASDGDGDGEEEQ